MVSDTSYKIRSVVSVNYGVSTFHAESIFFGRITVTMMSRITLHVLKTGAFKDAILFDDSVAHGANDGRPSLMLTTRDKRMFSSARKHARPASPIEFADSVYTAEQDIATLGFDMERDAGFSEDCTVITSCYSIDIPAETYEKDEWKSPVQAQHPLKGKEVDRGFH